jgi:hypothetical protein
MALEQDSSAVALGDRKRRMPIVVRRTPGKPSHAGSLHAIKPTQDLVDPHRTGRRDDVLREPRQPAATFKLIGSPSLMGPIVGDARSPE